MATGKHLNHFEGGNAVSDFRAAALLERLRAVAPGISEALITTAAGLAVAIPALVGYNQLTAQLRDFAGRMDDFGRELLNAIENAAMLTPQVPVAPPPEELTVQPRRRTF